MKVSRLTVDPLTNMPVVLLSSKRGDQALPIWIGLTEAGAIATELEKIALERPMTHDLMKNIIGECGVKVDRVEVHDVRDDVFYATVHMVGPGGKPLAVDARPSDAIALVLRTGARICVARKVIERVRGKDGEAGMAPAPEARSTARAKEPDNEVMRDLLEGLSDEAFGKWKM